MIAKEGGFSRLIALIREPRDDYFGLHRLLLELLYELSRIQRLSADDLGEFGYGDAKLHDGEDAGLTKTWAATIEDEFILYLFRITESLSSDVSDPYHYPVIRVILVLNEQYMLAAHSPPTSSTNTPQQQQQQLGVNRVLKALSTHGHTYKTFGENLILLLNRESETSLQLLILKLLYLIFATPATAEYFYTNDLHVLIDVIVRNLLDLPEESLALRHTYLRVLHPLLENSQLGKAVSGGYKKDHVRHCLRLVSRSPVQNEAFGGNEGCDTYAHWGPVDATTLRLVRRCLSVPWLAFPEDAAAAIATALASPPDDKSVAKKMLGMDLPEARESTLSVVEIARQTEKPGVLTPSLERRKSQRAVDNAERRKQTTVKGDDEDGTRLAVPAAELDEEGRSPFSASEDDDEG